MTCQCDQSQSNVNMDIADKFVRVLNGTIESIDDVAITSGKIFELRHTTEATKKLRMLCNKGMMMEYEDGSLGLSWWEGEEQFKNHCGATVPPGCPEIDPEQETPEWVNYPSDEPRNIKCHKDVEGGKKPRAHRHIICFESMLCGRMAAVREAMWGVPSTLLKTASRSTT